MELKVTLMESAARFEKQIKLLGAVTDIVCGENGLALSCEK